MAGHLAAFLWPILTVVMSTTLVAWLMDWRVAKVRRVRHYVAVAFGGLLVSYIVLFTLLTAVSMRHG
jgi:CO/xanthine dehydrogenase Mo-binding subunit